MGKTRAVLFSGLLAVVLGTGARGEGRPVSYEGGTTLEASYDADAAVFLAHYSLKPYFAVGWRTEYRRDADWVFNGAQLNGLLKRWNKADAQANLWVSAGLGSAYSDAGEFDGRAEFSAFAGVAADWENRRLYFSYANREFYAGEIEKMFEQRLRFGFAPYVGEFGDIHTWCLLEVKHSPESDDKVVLTPFLRFFKGAFLWEIGVSEHGDVMTTATVVF